MNSTYKRMSRVGIAALTTISLTLSPLASPVFAAEVGLGNAPTAGQKQIYEAGTSALIIPVSSELDYASAADGARYDAQAHSVVLPFVSYDADSRTATYAGAYNTRDNCTDAGNRNTCLEDYAFNQIKIVMDENGTSGKLIASFAQHRRGQVVQEFDQEWTLNFTNARFNTANGVTTWVDVARSQNASAISFSYVGAKVGSSTAPAPAAGMQLVKNSTVFNNIGPNLGHEALLPLSDGAVALWGARYEDNEVRVVNAAFDQISDATVLGDKKSRVNTYDAVTNTFYFIANKNELKKMVLTASGAGAVEDVVTLTAAEVPSIAFNNGKIGVILQDAQDEFTFVEVDPTNGSVSSPFAVPVDIDGFNKNHELVQKVGWSGPDITTLFALSDGSYFSFAGGSYDGQAAPPLRIIPQTQQVELISSAQSGITENKALKRAYVSGNNVVFWGKKKVSVFTYADGSLTFGYDIDWDDDAKGPLTGVAIKGDSLFLLGANGEDADHETLYEHALATGTQSSTLDIPAAGVKNGSNSYLWNRLAVSGDKIFAAVNHNSGKWNNGRTGVAEISASSASGNDGSDSSVSPITIGEYDAAEKYEPVVAPATVTLKTTESASSNAPTFDDLATTDVVETAAAPADTTFSITPAVAGASVNNAGVVTFDAADVAEEKTVPVVVTATYSDSTTDTYTVTFEVKKPAAAPINESGKFYYYTGSEYVRLGQTGTFNPKFKTNDSTDAGMPSGTTYAVEGAAPEGFSVNENTGVITFTPASVMDEPTNVRIRATYSDTTTSLTGVSIQAIEAAPTYDKDVFYSASVYDVPAGTTFKVKPLYGDKSEPEQGVEVPSDANFEYTIQSEPAGMTLNSITGEITYTPASDASGTYYPTIFVKRNGSIKHRLYPSFRVAEQSSTQTGPEIEYTTVDATVGKQYTSEPSFWRETPRYHKVEKPNVPMTFTMTPYGNNALPTSMQIDSSTGVVTFTPGQNDFGQDVYASVSVSYDGLEDPTRSRLVLFKVAKKISDTHKVVFKDGEVEAGKSVTIAAPTFDNPATDDVVETEPAPEGTKFKLEADVEGVTINEDTGVVTYNAPAGAQTGDVAVGVVAIFPDTSVSHGGLTIKVTASSNPTPAKINGMYKVTYPVSEAKAGQKLTIDPKVVATAGGAASEVPAGTKFSIQQGSAEGFTINESTGVISYTAPASVDEDKSAAVGVQITYSDDSVSYSGARVNLKAEKTTPAKDKVVVKDVPASVKAGTKTTLEITAADGSELPAGTVLELVSPVDGVSISDGKLVIDPQKSSKDQKLTIRVRAQVPGEQEQVITVELNVDASEPSTTTTTTPQAQESGSSPMIGIGALLAVLLGGVVWMAKFAGLGLFDSILGGFKG